MGKTTGQWDSQYEWKAVLLLALGFGLVGLDRWMIGPLYPLMMNDLGLDYQDLGNIMGILGLAWGVSSLFAGRLADKIGRRKVLIPATILFSLMTGFTGVATGLTSLLIIRFMMGVSEGAFGPTSVALTAEASKPSRRGLNMGIQQSTFALLGIGLGPIIVTQLVQYLPSWHWVFVIMCMPGLILAYFMHRIIREPKHLQDSEVNSPLASVSQPKSYTYKDLFKYRNILVGIVCMCCVMTCVFILSAMSPVYFTNYLHLTVSQMGFVTSGIGFGAFAGQVVIPALSDRFGRKSITVLALLIAAGLLYQFIQTPAQPFTLFMLLFFIAFGANSCLCMIGGTIAVESVPVALGSTAVGLIIGIGEIFGGGVAPILAGWIAQSYGIQYTMYLALGGLVACCFFALFFKETAPIKLTKEHAPI